MNRVILIKYGELTTKKGNRNFFITTLYKNITKKLKDHKGDGLIDSGFRSSKFPCAMFSSTEGDAGQAITLRFKPNGLSVISPFGAPQGKFIIDNMPKNTMETGLYKVKYGTRAVHKF